MFLSSAPVGAPFTVVGVILDKEVGKRLADMGFTGGAEGVVIRGGFMRGPLQVQIRGYDILIRRCEAAGIEIQLQAPVPALSDLSRPSGGRGRRRSGAGPGGNHGRFGAGRRNGQAKNTGSEV